MLWKVLDKRKNTFNSMAYVSADCKFVCWRGSQNNLAKAAEHQWKANSGWYLNLASPLKCGVFCLFLQRDLGKKGHKSLCINRTGSNTLNSSLLISTSYQEQQGTKREKNTEELYPSTSIFLQCNGTPETFILLLKGILKTALQCQFAGKLPYNI